MNTCSNHVLYCHEGVDLREHAWLDSVPTALDLQRCTQPPVGEGPFLWLGHDGLNLVSSRFGRSFNLAESAGAAGRGLVQKVFANTEGMSVLDAFAGFGQDTLALAHSHRLECVERNPVVHVLLSHYVWQHRLPVRTTHDDAFALLQRASHSWDVIYLDPMFPARKKQALPNRGMQLLRMLQVEQPLEPELDELLDLARQRATRKVILKRRLKDAVAHKPSSQLRGRTIRFDVYAC